MPTMTPKRCDAQLPRNEWHDLAACLDPEGNQRICRTAANGEEP